MGCRRRDAGGLLADRLAALPPDPDPLGPLGGHPRPRHPAPAARGTHRVRPHRERDRMAAARPDPDCRGVRSPDLRGARRRRRRAPVEQLGPGRRDSRGGLQHGQQADAADHPAVHPRGLHPRRRRRSETARDPLPRALRLDAGRDRGGRPRGVGVFHLFHRGKRGDDPRDGGPDVPHDAHRRAPSEVCDRSPDRRGLAGASAAPLAGGHPLRAHRRGGHRAALRGRDRPDGDPDRAGGGFHHLS